MHRDLNISHAFLGFVMHQNTFFFVLMDMKHPSLFTKANENPQNKAKDKLTEKKRDPISFFLCLHSSPFYSTTVAPINRRKIRFFTPVFAADTPPLLGCVRHLASRTLKVQD